MLLSSLEGEKQQRQSARVCHSQAPGQLSLLDWHQLCGSVPIPPPRSSVPLWDAETRFSPSAPTDTLELPAGLVCSAPPGLCLPSVLSVSLCEGGAIGQGSHGSEMLLSHLPPSGSSCSDSGKCPEQRGLFTGAFPGVAGIVLSNGMWTHAGGGRVPAARAESQSQGISWLEGTHRDH